MIKKLRNQPCALKVGAGGKKKDLLNDVKEIITSISLQ
jgi:hypothetical protein